jgi:glycosyltransferase involved in cell wall biosynthesis
MGDKMSKVSILMPSRNETYKTNFGTTVLQQTVQDILQKATGDYELLVMFDGEPYQDLPKHPNLRVFYNKEPIGSKPCINELVKQAKGKYIFKLDSHCMVAEGFDEILQSSMEDNWVVIPRFYVLNAEDWKWQDERFYDYFYLPCPFTDPKQFRFQAGGHWKQRTAERLDIPVDENMKLHGSAFFLGRDFFINNLKELNYEIDNSSGEDIEISLKTWLGPWDGKLMVNKNTWYAHMHKGGQRPRGYPMGNSQIRNTYDWIANYWIGNTWEGREHDLEWLIERFEVVPTWPTNWHDLWDEWKRNKK